MRYQGRITTWHDEKGFGFITPNGNGKQVFVHIKSFLNRQRRPVGNELVTYELNTDTKGRINAEDVAFVGESVLSASPSNLPFALALLFLFSMGVAVLAGKLPSATFGFYCVASIIAFFAYYFDKSAARNNHWRTPESTLHFCGLIGGWPGALLAQRLFRHKTKKTAFQVVFWITVVLNMGIIAWLLFSPAAQSVRDTLGMPALHAGYLSQ